MVRGVVLFLGILYSASAVPRPHYILPCSRSSGFSECALKNAKHAVPFLLKGDRDLKIPNMSPLIIPMVDLQGNKQFHLKIKNMEVHGLDTVELQSVRVDFDKQKLEVNSTADKLTILGDYEMDGKILMFPLTGKGRLNNTLYNGKYQYTVNWELETRGGEKYAKIVDSSYDYKLERMSFDFKNLFNGDKMLGEQMNLFLNENWELVNEDLKKAIVQTLLAVHTDLATKIFSSIPFEDLFLD